MNDPTPSWISTRLMLLNDAGSKRLVALAQKRKSRTAEDNVYPGYCQKKHELVRLSNHINAISDIPRVKSACHISR